MAKTRHAAAPFGDALLVLMEEHDVTFRGLGAKVGLSAGYLNHIAHGSRPVPSNEVIEAIAVAFAVEPVLFREYRLREVIARVENDPALIDALWRKYA